MISSISGPSAQREVARHIDDENTMRLAPAAAPRAGRAGEPPIGAALVRNGLVIATAGNSVISSLDITARAEINLIRDACHKERSHSPAGCDPYTTVEPCPMCFAATHHAGIGRFAIGASREDPDAITGAEMLAGPRPTEGWPALSGGCLRSESLTLLKAGFDRGTVRRDG